MGLARTLLSSRLAAALTSPHPVDRYLAALRPTSAVSDVRATITEIRRETSGAAPVATLELQPTPTWRGHRAGQHVHVGVDLPGTGRRFTRTFTVSSAESGPGEPFALTIRANPGGVVSSYLVTEASVGQLVHLSQATGAFTLNQTPATVLNSHLLMISGGSGITPVMSQLRTLLRHGYDGHVGRRVTFLHYARSRQDQIYADELAAIAAADNGVSVHLRYGDHLFSAEELGDLVGDYRDLDTWACGPEPMMELIATAYGVTPTSTSGSRLRLEFFTPPTPTPAAASSVSVGEITFTRSGISVANSGEPLLAQAEAAGLSPTFGCRMGICHSCVVRKHSGTVHNSLDDTTSAADDEDIRVCVSTPQGDCAVDL